MLLWKRDLLHLTFEAAFCNHFKLRLWWNKFSWPKIFACMLIVGGVIPQQDCQYFYDAGAVAIFDPGTVVIEAGIKILEILIEAGKEE
jgi:hypothetical protein